MSLIDEKIKEFKILGIGSSFRKNSSSSRVLKIVLELSKTYGADISILEISEIDFPIFNPNKPREIPDVIKNINNKVIDADAFILATPDYHGTMSGGMKNFLDYYWYEFAGKLFGCIVSSHEKGLTVMDHMRTVIRQCYGWSIPYGISVHSENDFNEQGNIKNAKLQKRINNMARDIVIYGKILRAQFLHDINSNESNTFAAQFIK